MKDKIKKKKLIFNEDGDLKGSLDTINDQGLSPFKVLKIEFEDDEGRELIAKELDRLAKAGSDFLASLSFPERMKAYGHTFESLAEAYRTTTNEMCELARRLRLMERWKDEKKTMFCSCSAMVWDQEFEGNLVPYFYCVIKGGERTNTPIDGLEKGCATCENTPCDHFYEPEHNSGDCQDYIRRKSKRYPVTPCIYANPSDVDIDFALELYREELR